VAGKTNWLSDKTLSLMRGTTVTGHTETWVNLLKTLPTGDTAAGIAVAEEWHGGGGVVGTGGTGRIRVYPDQASGTPWWGATQTFGDLRYIANAATLSWTTGNILNGAAWVDLTVRGIAIWNSDRDLSPPGTNDMLYWERFDDNRVIGVDEEFILPPTRFKVREA